VWASMDAFTTEIRKIAIPTMAADAFFQQEVANLVVASNDNAVTAGTFPTGGNIEYWPNNYTPGNSAHVAGASDQLFDFGDQPISPKDGYCCMQVHNHGTQQTIFAINHWVAGRAADIGIGNSAGPQSRDWTFSGNAGSWSKKQLRIYIRLKP
jgi:sialate O-acetylesterase